MMKLLFSIAMLLNAAPAIAQDNERRFAVARFDSVELASSDRVEIAKGAGFAVTASGAPRALASLAVSVRDGTLRVDRERGSSRGGAVTVRVVLPDLRAAILSGSGSIRATGVIGTAFAGRVAGSGSMDLVGVSASSIRLDLGGSGSIRADGGAQAVTIGLFGSGEVDARRLATPAIVVEHGGSGTVAATAARTAIVRASGSGDVRIDGHPHCDVASSGSGSGRCG